MTTRTRMTWERAKTQISRFNTLRSARSFAFRAAETNANKVAWNQIILGDDGCFWVTTPRVAAWLIKNGYQEAE